MAKRLGKQLFVSKLSFYTTNKRLENLFSPFGVVREARLVIDPRTQRPKGFGFVTFESEGEAQKALKAMNGRMHSQRLEEGEGCTYPSNIVDGRLIFVEVAKSIKPKDDASS